ncbi:MAG: hypothetical protein GY941_04135 [Planctomycetes bacterium]|nr:hypothetical protein [Planctomycetota bacterium]
MTALCVKLNNDESTHNRTRKILDAQKTENRLKICTLHKALKAEELLKQSLCVKEAQYLLQAKQLRNLIKDIANTAQHCEQMRNKFNFVQTVQCMKSICIIYPNIDIRKIAIDSQVTDDPNDEKQRMDDQEQDRIHERLMNESVSDKLREQSNSQASNNDNTNLNNNEPRKNKQSMTCLLYIFMIYYITN